MTRTPVQRVTADELRAELAKAGGPRKRKASGATARQLPTSAGVPGWGDWELTLEVPGNPVAWARTEDSVHGGRFNPKRVTDAEKMIGALARYQMGNRLPLNGPVEIWFWFYRATRHRVDGSNLQKLVEDGFTGVVWCDDNQAKDWHGHVRLDPANPRTLIRVRPGPPDAWEDWG